MNNLQSFNTIIDILLSHKIKIIDHCPKAGFSRVTEAQNMILKIKIVKIFNISK